jgi:hypothetical protein
MVRPIGEGFLKSLVATAVRSGAGAGQAPFIEPNVHERRDGASDTEGDVVERVVLQHQAAHMAAGEAVDLGTAVLVARAAPGTGGGKLLERVGGVGHSHSMPSD